tara:strand:+ start:7328 stop:8215 length:888 start_codon:yes stop_codon:yes gene_type:complete
MGKNRNKIYKRITSQVIAGLEAGHIPWKKPWVGERAPKNYKTRHAYTGANLWVLLARPFDSNLWLTFKQAQELGGSVMKGEKGTQICYWNIRSRDVVDKETGEKKEKKAFFLKTFTVFNAEQIEGVEFNEPEATTGATTNEEAEKLLSEYKNSPELVYKAVDTAYYSAEEDKVVLPRRKSFLSTTSYYSTLFHELGHSTGHPSRLDRDGIANFDHFGSEKYTKEELIAEMSACFLMSMCGLTAGLEQNNQAYINGWITKLKSDPKVLFEASREAQKACDYMLGEQVSFTDENIPA